MPKPRTSGQLKSCHPKRADEYNHRRYPALTMLHNTFLDLGHAQRLLTYLNDGTVQMPAVVREGWAPFKLLLQYPVGVTGGGDLLIEYMY